MQLTRVVIKNYRAIRDATVEFQRGLTIVVGDNEAGKSTLLEAIQLAISGRVDGRYLRNQLHPLLFNMETCRAFAAAHKAGATPPPPEILIEVYFSDEDELVQLKGTNNSRREDAPGISLRIAVADHLTNDFASYVAAATEPHLLPTELFDVSWQSFADGPMSGRRPLFRSTLIAAGAGDAHNGTSRYLAGVMGEHLSDDEQLQLSLAYRSMKDKFQNLETVRKLNAQLQERRGEVSSKTLSIAMDPTSSSDWDRGVAPLLDDIPLGLVGSGEQAAVRIWLALNVAKTGADLVMVEEPESHLTHARLNILLERMCQQIDKRQLFVTTHSSFVVNKLGLGELLLFNRSSSMRLTDLSPDTAAYFKKLPGHDTLRMVLAKRVILVEGPSDELVVQRAYRDLHGKRPIEDGIDVLAVRSLSFDRYLDIAVRLQTRVAVLLDNDGDVDRVREKYARFNGISHITLCYSEDPTSSTLEPLLVKSNSLKRLNCVLRKNFDSQDAAVNWMLGDKTESALRIHEAADNLDYPDCIARVVA